MEETKSEQIIQPSKELLTGKETAKVISEIYETIGPTNGCQLVEPTAVLTIAGLKGYTFLVDAVVNEEETQKADDLNRHLESIGIKIKYSRGLNQMLITNLKGLEYKTKRTKLPGFFPYLSILGFKGKNTWHDQIEENLEKARKSGEISPDIDTQIYEEGILFGYPDKAVIDFEKTLRTGDIQKDLVDSDIETTHPFSKKYEGPSCDFHHDPSSANDPEIVEYIERAKQILKDFYNSELLIKISQDPKFLVAREAQELRCNKRTERMLRKK